MTFALLTQFCQLVWLGMLGFSSLYLFLSFDLVGSLAQIPSQTQILCHT